MSIPSRASAERFNGDHRRGRETGSGADWLRSQELVETRLCVEHMPVFTRNTSCVWLLPAETRPALQARSPAEEKDEKKRERERERRGAGKGIVSVPAELIRLILSIVNVSVGASLSTLRLGLESAAVGLGNEGTLCSGINRASHCQPA